MAILAGKCKLEATVTLKVGIQGHECEPGVMSRGEHWLRGLALVGIKPTLKGDYRVGGLDKVI